MLKRLLAMVLFSLAGSLAVAASTAQPAKTLLWRITSHNRTMYLAGDTQVLLPRDFPLPVQVDQAFEDSGELVLEGDPGADSKQVSALIRQYGLLPTPTTLSDILEAPQEKLIKRIFGEVGTPFDKMGPLRPWLATIVLLQAAHAKLGCDPDQQETNYFYKLAKSRNLPFTPVESAPAQLKLFADLPQTLQIAWLTMIAHQWEGPASEQEANRQDVVKAWRTGKTDVLSKALARQFDGHTDLYRALVTHRNEAWMKMLEAKLAERGAPVFVLLGAGHLVGSGNIVSMLERAGYGVTQL